MEAKNPREGCAALVLGHYHQRRAGVARIRQTWLPTARICQPDQASQPARGTRSPPGMAPKLWRASPQYQGRFAFPPEMAFGRQVLMRDAAANLGEEAPVPFGTAGKGRGSDTLSA